MHDISPQEVRELLDDTLGEETKAGLEIWDIGMEKVRACPHLLNLFGEEV